MLTASGVLANFGGIPLAFAFLATIGNAGVVTACCRTRSGSGGFTLYSMTGLALVYLYFLIPLMVLTITPALEALRPQWREAADNLGASGWQYWRYVGGPVLAPPVIGATMLLFASAFAAYATARALVGSSVPLVTLQIANALSSNVVVGSENLGKALALGMVVLIGLVMAFYAWVQRRTQRWLADDPAARGRLRQRRARAPGAARGVAGAGLAVRRPDRAGPVLPDPDRRLGAVHRARPGRAGSRWSTTPASPAPRGSPRRSPGRWRWPGSPSSSCCC